MSTSLTHLVSLVATGLRGMRSRSLLTAGSLLLTAIAVAAAVVGPTYQSAAAASFLVTSLRDQPDTVTGFTLDYSPHAPVSSTQAADEEALGAVDPSSTQRFGAPELSLWTQRLAVTTWQYATGLPQATLLAEPGVCRRLVVTARCPSRAGETLLLESDAAYTHTHVGDRLEVQGLARPLTVVGTYRLPAAAGGWFDPSRFTSLPPEPSRSEVTPYTPAPFVVSPATMRAVASRDWFVRMDYRLQIPPSTTVGDLEPAVSEVCALRKLLAPRPRARLPALPFGATLTLETGNDLRSVVSEAQGRRITAEQTVTPAVVSLILVALVLLVRLLSSAMELRRPELALASLRGISRRQLWVLAMLEPVLMLVLATPAGVVLGYLADRWLAAAWLVPGLPVGLGASSVWFATGVLVASLMVAALAVRSTVAEPVSAQISGVRRPTRPGRWAVLSRLTLVAAALAVLTTTLLSGGQSSPEATDLLLPILLAVAAGLAMTMGAASVARWWARWSARRRGVAGYVASRTIARRREGTWVVLPLTAALAISVFAAGVYATAASWRASAAATLVGADTAFHVKLPLSRAVTLTHRLDPGGMWLMAVGADADTNGPKVIIDASRLARVAVWPGSWTPGMSVAEVQRELSPDRPPLTLTGRRVQMTVDNSVEGDHASLQLNIDMVTRHGQTRHLFLGPYPHGQATRSASTDFCGGGCEVTGLTISAPGTLPATMAGTVTIKDVRADEAAVPYFAGIGWRGVTSSTFVYGGPAVTSTRVTGSTLQVDLDSAGQPVDAMLTPQDVPATVPVLMGRTADPVVLTRQGSDLTVATALGTEARVHPVGTSESTPFFGPSALLVDHTMYTRTNQVLAAETSVYILARADTPRSVLASLAAHGISERTTLQQVRHLLDQDAYALALNLYLVVTAIVLLLGLAGLTATMAAQLPARRRDAASLRVVGLRRRSILTAVAAEFAAVLGTATVAGILSGALSQYAVVRTLTLGYADTAFTPRVLPSLELTQVAALLAIAFAVLVCLAVALGSATVHGARTATLREGNA